MKTTVPHDYLSAYVLVIRQDGGAGERAKSIRHPLLIDRATGLLYELPTTYILRQLGKKSLNTQVTTLYDLAFYLEWVRLKQRRSSGKTWPSPNLRIRAGHLALTDGEVVDLSNWCQKPASDLSKVRNRERGNLRTFSTAEPVESSTTNRRLNNICNYLIWLTKNMVEGTFKMEDSLLAKSIHLVETLKMSFASQLNSEKKPVPQAALLETSSKRLRAELVKDNLFPNDAHGRRDRLITYLLLESGLRAGELLKLYAADIDTSYKVSSTKTIAIAKVIRRPNDIHDDRVHEPAVKTLPGPVSIPRQLGSELVSHIINDRRKAVNLRRDGKETPYLFVCLSGKRIGKPISRRNLNRIIAKIKTIDDPGLKNVSPHILRHTHFTEFADTAMEGGATPADIRSAMLSRGHWSSKSTMPAHYSQSHIIKMQDAYNSARENSLKKRD